MKARRSESDGSAPNLFGMRLSTASSNSDCQSSLFGSSARTSLASSSAGATTTAVPATASTIPDPVAAPPAPLAPPVVPDPGLASAPAPAPAPGLAASPLPRRPSFQPQASTLDRQDSAFWGVVTRRSSNSSPPPFTGAATAMPAQGPPPMAPIQRPPPPPPPPPAAPAPIATNEHLSPHSEASSGDRNTPVNNHNRQYRTTTPIEEFVAKYSVIKCSWRGKYERIFALAPTRFCTIDPKDFEVTNTWSLSGLLDIHLDASDPEALTLSLRGTKKDEQLKLRCAYRAHFVSDLLAQRELFSQKGQSFHNAQGFGCEKLARNDLRVPCLLEIGVDGVVCKSPDGRVRSKYLFVRMSQVALLANSPDGFAWYDGARVKIFFSQYRSQIMNQINEAAKKVGLFQLGAGNRNNHSLEQLRQSRLDATKDVGVPFVIFETKKHTCKYKTPIERLLSLHQKHIVEIDMNGAVVSCRPYTQIFCLVRSQKKSREFEIQYLDGESRKYICDDRDGILAAIYDLCVTCNENPALCINAVTNGKGVKLNPLFVSDICMKPSMVMEECSIGTYFLVRMAAVGKYATASSRRSATSGDRGFVSIVAEFNANVPASGIDYHTKAPLIVDALRPLGSQLYHVSKSKPFAPVMAVTLVQALYRIASSCHGFREIAQVQQISDSITNLLVNGDELTIFWTTELLTKLTCHSAEIRAGPSSRQDMVTHSGQDEIEAYNKKLFFTNTYLVQSLVDLLDGIERRSDSPTWKHLGTGENDSKCKRKSEQQRNRRIGPLSIMGTLQTLECALCSRKHTTGRGEFKMIVSLVAKYHSTLLSVLFRSRCATTVEACTLLMKTILEECEPDVAWSIKEAALMEGIVLRHFYQAVFDESFDQRCVSRYLISLWMSNFEPAKKLLRRMIPYGFLSSLRAPPLCASEIAEFDQIERDAMATSTTRTCKMSNCTTFSERYSTISSDSPQGPISPSFANSSNAIQSFSQEVGLESSRSCSSLLLHEAPKAQIENKYTKARMLQKLQESSVVPTDESVTSDSSSPTAHSNDGHRVRKRDIAFHFVASAVSKIKHDHHRPPPARSASLGSMAASRSRAVSREHATPTTSPSMLRNCENFRLLFYLLSKDHEQVDLIWNETTREELFTCLSSEIQCLSNYRSGHGNAKCIWNYEDFRVVYPSLDRELVVGNLYPRVLCALLLAAARGISKQDNEVDVDNCRSSIASDETLAKQLGEDNYQVLPKDFVAVKDPQSFLSALYMRILRENIRVEYRDQLECTLQCLQCISIVSSSHPKYSSFKEMTYLITLLQETTHAAVLEHLVRAIRSLVMLPTNAKRLLETGDQLESLVHVLLLGHLAQRYSSALTNLDHATSESLCLWMVEGVDGTRNGPYRIRLLKDLLRQGSIHLESATFVRLPSAISRPTSTQFFKINENVQLRWELALKGDIHPLQLAHDAASILLALAHSNKLLERCLAKDPNDFVSLKSSVVPTSNAKALLWKYMTQFVTILVRFQSPALCAKVINLLEFLYAESDGTVLPMDSGRHKMFASGLFFFVFVFSGDSYESLSGLLKSVHLCQEAMHDKSALTGILPQAMINFLCDCSSAKEFAELFCGQEVSPKIIWKASMHDHLRQVCQGHIQSFAEELEEDMFTEWVHVPMAPIAYEELAEEIWCGDVYLAEFCKPEHAHFVIANPLEFMEKLRKQWQEEANRVKSEFTKQQAAERLGVENADAMALDLFAIRAAYKHRAQEIVLETTTEAEDKEQSMKELNELYRVITAPRPSLVESSGHDPHNLVLILNSLTTMCQRYPGALESYAFGGYDMLLSLLVSHCSTNGQRPEFTTESQQEVIAAKAAEFLFLSCDVSEANGEILLQQDLVSLEKVLNFCMHCLVDHPDSSNVAHVSKICLYLLQTIAILVDSWTGKQWIAKTSTIILDLVQLLWYWNNQPTEKRSFEFFKIVDQILVIFAHMALHEANQDLLLEHGVLWQLVVLFAQEYDCDLDQQQVAAQLFVNGEMIHTCGMGSVEKLIQNYLAVRSILVLCRLGGFYSDHSKQYAMTPQNEPLHVIVDSMMTPSLAALLVLENHHEFLKLFHSDCESYTLFWTEAMRKELLELVQPKASVRPDATMHEKYEEIVRFRFEYLGQVLNIGGLYIRTLIDSMLQLGQDPNMIPEGELGLTEQFFEDLFRFIETCKLKQPKWSRDDGEELLAPFAGWNIPANELCATHRHTCLICLEAISFVVPTLVERNLVKQEWALRMLFRFLFPPDNEVNTQQTMEGEPELPLELYIPCRSNCVHVLDALAELKDFAMAACKYEFCEILIEVIHTCPDPELGPLLLGIIRKLCASPARAEVVKSLLESGSYLEFIAWFLITDEVVTEEDFALANTLRMPSARILSEMAKPQAILGDECNTAFCRYFPVSMVREIVLRPNTCVDFIMADHDNPELIWNQDYRLHVRAQVAGFMAAYNDWLATSEEDAPNIVESFGVDYSEFNPSPVVGGVYMQLYLQNPTYKLGDPSYFAFSLFSTMEDLCGNLIRLTNATRASLTPDDDMSAQRDNELLYLVSSCLVCVLRVNPWLLDQLGESKYPTRCCTLLQECSRTRVGESMMINLARVLRVLVLSAPCIASFQDCTSNLLSSLMTQLAAPHGNLRYETGYALEIIRRLVFNYPDHGERDSKKGIVAITAEAGLFKFLLNLLDTSLESVREPEVARSEAVQILHMLELDRFQSYVAHSILKKHKKWEKKYKYEATRPVMSTVEDPFLQGHAPDADRLIEEYTMATRGSSLTPPAGSTPSTTPAATAALTPTHNSPHKDQPTTKGSPRNIAVISTAPRDSSANDVKKQHRDYKRLFSSR